MTDNKLEDLERDFLDYLHMNPNLFRERPLLGTSLTRVLYDEVSMGRGVRPCSYGGSVWCLHLGFLGQPAMYVFYGITSSEAVLAAKESFRACRLAEKEAAVKPISEKSGSSRKRVKS